MISSLTVDELSSKSSVYSTEKISGAVLTMSRSSERFTDHVVLKLQTSGVIVSLGRSILVLTPSEGIKEYVSPKYSCSSTVDRFGHATVNSNRPWIAVMKDEYSLEVTEYPIVWVFMSDSQALVEL